MTTKPKTRKAPAKPAARKRDANETAPNPDPVFASISDHKALQKEWHRLNTKLDEAQFQAQETHGAKPLELIAWRNYEAIGGYELERARDEFLREPGAIMSKSKRNTWMRRRGWPPPSVHVTNGISA